MSFNKKHIISYLRKWIFERKRYRIIPLVLVVCLLSCKTQTKDDFTKEIAQQNIKAAWEQTYPAILEAIHPPAFKDTIVHITDTLDFRDRLNIHITDLSNAGGGIISVRPGIYNAKGSIFMKSNINLHLSEGAILLFSPNPEDYLPVVKSRWEGTFLMNYSPLIYAIDAENIAITGKGTINGQTQPYWADWKNKQAADKKLLRQMGNDQVPLSKRIFGEGHFLRPSGIEFINCKNILLEGFTIKNSPFWTIHPVLCENITAKNLNIRLGTTNDDGFDPESCKNVLIENCIFNTHDDCIAIKAGRDQDGWPYPPSENIIVRNNSFNTAVGSGFCIGSEMSAGVKNVFVENCKLSKSEKHAFQFKSNPDRGGFIENVFVRNIDVGDVKYGFEFTTNYKGWRGNENFTRYEHFYFQDISIKSALEKSITVNGRPEKPIRNIFFQNIAITDTNTKIAVKNTTGVLFDNVKINSKTIDKKLESQ
ncbi:glycoside hydrolase family 28 protein [Flagellimonas sp. HMM57]|uniref:glycoside hydrolase family 28 protein n=1 Tax=unclassified Flagellimonas TaxID=2644544 RepID=UPI0013D5B857|nr:MULTISPECIES: glycoside hydrolase family 28 protein [unclassified Flagellimonas]UII76515.1 glycoside hydrolase family 28 protein [Flagellimonas sp. HMM57]